MLENKLGITSSVELSSQEERISKKKALELFKNGNFESLEAGKTLSLIAIHTMKTIPLSKQRNMLIARQLFMEMMDLSEPKTA